MPAEWEPHEATWLAWPHEKSDWPGKFAPIPWLYGEIVRHLARVERVRILVQDSDAEQAARRILKKCHASLDAVEFFHHPTNRSWTRDYCPLFVKNKTGEVAVTHWRFNGWAKYDNCRDDARTPAFVARKLKMPRFETGLVLEGGSDVWPGSYGETALQERWSGDRVRDEYEKALAAAFVAERKPVLGICRGLQLLNVAYGGTLYQDIATQRPDAISHREASLYDRHFHEVEFVPGSRLATLHAGVERAKVNSVHHQAIKDLAPGFVVEARSVPDGLIEAVRRPGDLFVAAVQWHPEFHRPDQGTLDDGAMLKDFLDAARAAMTR